MALSGLGDLLTPQEEHIAKVGISGKLESFKADVSFAKQQLQKMTEMFDRISDQISDFERTFYSLYSTKSLD